jgi:hypothetical protein
MSTIIKRYREQLKSKEVVTRLPPNQIAVDDVFLRTEFLNTILSFESQLGNSIELTSSQLESLKSISHKILRDTSAESQSLRRSIAGLKDFNLRLRTLHYTEKLENEYDQLEREFFQPDTTIERKKELAERSKIVSETLQLLQR